MALTDQDEDGTLRTLRHHYENVRDHELDQGVEMGAAPTSRNGVYRGENLDQGESTEVWVDWNAGEVEDREDLDGTLTNSGQKVVEKSMQLEQRQLNVSRELF